MITSVLKKAYKTINEKAIHDTQKERMPYKKQNEYLNKFSEPKDDYARSYYKYKCFCEYCYYNRKWIVTVYNLGSMFLLPSIYSKLRKAYKQPFRKEKADAVIENITRLPNTDIIPDELRGSFTYIKEIKELDYSESFLSDNGERIYRELRRRYFFHFYYRMIVLQKLGLFSSYLERYQPDTIVFYSCEREFSGPLQTLLCEKSGAKYIAFMHGDYLSTLSFAFQRYSLYYVWDNSYKRMFEALRCVSPMQTYMPKKLKGVATAIDEKDCKYFATYYFSDENRAEAENVHTVFLEFEKYGLRTKIRPHPRFSDMNMLQDVFRDIEIEDTKNFMLGESITNTLYVVGLNTTVLSEAFFSEKKVVIDDISNPIKYKELNDRNYIMIKRPHILLSELKEGLYKEFGKGYAFYKY